MKPASLCLVLLLALGACKSADPTAAVPSGAGAGDGAGDGSASTAAPADSGSLSDVAPADSADATDAIAAALQRVVDKGAYRVTMSAGGVATQAEIQLPDRLRIVIGDMGQVVMIGPDTYSEQNGQWSRISTAGSLGNIMEQLVPDLEAVVQDARALGMETLDGQACDVYSYSSSQDLGSGKVPVTVKLWVARDTGLPRRQTVSGEEPAMAASLTSDFSYDGDIAIEAPATFTDLGAGPGPGAGAGPGPGGTTAP